jgi:hypothetical protein
MGKVQYLSTNLQPQGGWRYALRANGHCMFSTTSYHFIFKTEKLRYILESMTSGSSSLLGLETVIDWQSKTIQLDTTFSIHMA